MMRTFVLFCSLILLVGCSQNVESVGSGETLENSPKPIANNNSRLTSSAPGGAPGGAPFAGGGNGGPPDPQMMLNKA